MERNRQKLVGRDKGHLTEQQTTGTVTTKIQIRRKYNTNRTTQRAALPDRTGAACSRAASEFPSPRSTHWNPAWWHMVWNTGLCLARWGQPASCARSWIPVKINPVLAEPRTLSTPYSIPSTSYPGLPLSSWSLPLLLSPDIIPLVYGSSL